MRLAVIDAETTGLPLHPSVDIDKQPYIIEFAARVVTEKGLEDEFIEFLCDPGIPLENVITKITGLTDADLKGEKPFAYYFQTLEHFFRSCDGIVAHNLPFDSYMLWLEVQRANWEEHWVWPSIRVCTSQLFEPTFGYRPKLVALYEYITGEKYKQTHRALDDADALAEIVSSGEVIEAIKLSTVKGQDGIYIPEDICPD